MTMHVVDLSLPLAQAMPRYPSPYLPDVELRPVARHEREGRSVHVLVCGTHVSTHMDAPYHALPAGDPIDRIPVSNFIGPARILRIPKKNKETPVDRSDLETFSDLDRWERLILHTGWAQRTWGGREYFIEGPFLTRAAAHFLSERPNLKLLGMDFPNVDAAHETVVGIQAPNHTILLTRGRVLLENIFQLEQVDDRFLLSTAPLKLVGADGSPCRPVAIFPLSEICKNWGE